MTSLCLRTQLTDEQREYLEAVMYSGENLLTLINDIIDITRIEAGELSVQAVKSRRKTLLDRCGRRVSGGGGTKELTVRARSTIRFPMS